MASSALRRSLQRCGPLRRILLSHPTSADAAASASSFRRHVHSGEGEIESLSQFEEHIFGGKGTDDRTLFQQLDKVENTRSKFGMGFGRAAFGQSGDRSKFGFGERSNFGFGDSSNFGNFGNFGSGDSSFGSVDGYNSLKDGMDEKLDDAARTFQMSEEVYDEDYDFRPDVNYKLGSKYSPRDLDLTRPAAAKNPPRPQFETTTKEVLKKADFRNVRFLSNFLTEAGIIIKRRQTKISAKAQRKVAREIKTSRALGLMPFTTMGKRPFIFGRTVEEDVSEEEYGYDFVEPRDAGPEDDVGGDAVPDIEAA